MECRLTVSDHSGSRWQLTQILTLHVISSLDSPANGLEATAILHSAPPVFERVRLESNGRVIFDGMVDEQILECSTEGLILELCARTDGALLLDNEALPLAYENCRLSDLAARCLTPYGVFRLDVPATVYVPSFTVGKGWSDWEALCRFCRRAMGCSPYLDRELCLRTDTQPHSWHTISNERAQTLHYRRFRWKDDRSVVVSKVCLRDKNGYYSTAVTSSEAEKIGVRRKRYTIPDSEYASRPAQGADTLLKRSMAKRCMLTLELPGLEELWPGDGVRLPDRPFPMQEMTVTQLEWKITGRERMTVLELCDPKYAGYLGD